MSESEPDKQTQKRAQIKAILGVAAKTHSLNTDPIVNTGITYADWNAAEKTVYNDINGMGIYKPTKGDGSAANPFEISTLEALAWFAYVICKETKGNWRMVMKNDIDLDEEKYNSDTGRLKWSGINIVRTSRQVGRPGIIDGNGHVILNFYTSIGLIGGALDGTI